MIVVHYAPPGPIKSTNSWPAMLKVQRYGASVYKHHIAQRANKGFNIDVPNPSFNVS